MKRTPPPDAEQLQLFPGFDARQRPLFADRILYPVVPPAPAPSSGPSVARCDSGECPCPGCIADLTGDGT